MTTTQRIIKNSFFLTGGNVVAKALNLVLLLILTRMLGREGFGLYSFAFAYVMLFLLFTHLGLNTYLVREIAKDKSSGPEHIALTLPLVLICSLLTAALVNGIAWMVNWSGQERLIIAVFSGYMIFDALGRYLFSIFRAYERMAYEALVYMTERAGLLIVTLIGWQLNWRLESLVAWFTLIMVLKLLLAWYFVHRHFFPLKLRWNGSEALAMLRQAYPFALVGIFGAMSMRIDTIMLKVFHSADAVGLYNTGRKLVESLAFIPENIAFAMFPALSVLFLSDPKKFQETFTRILQYMLIIALPLTIGSYLLAPRFIELLFEPEFARSYIALQWLSLWLGILFLKYAFATTLNVVGKQHLFSLFAGISMVLNVVLNYLLIPQYDIGGAGFATVVSEAAGLLLIYIGLRKFTGLPRFSPIFVKLLLVGGGFYLVLFWLQSANLFLAIGGSGLIYLLLLLLTGSVSREDYLYFRGVIAKKLSARQVS
ncbi:MAG: flippase [Calditrichae bacterium]|nr:flippase [Calditrichota bacterium]MCB0295605.1 flippase [Calditrichota bacterium]MCB0313408.1 flippase [Calditrichota bacterium]MCB9089105.1 flippase [Calditrichia bacterium]